MQSRLVSSVVLFIAIMSFTALSLRSEGSKPYSGVDEKSSEKAAQEMKSGGEVDPAEGLTAGSSPELIVYYFHGYQRCRTCRRIEELAHLALKEGFPDDLKTGRLQWQVVNIEADGNEHFVNDYSLFSRSLVVQKVEDGKKTDWNNLKKYGNL